MQTAGNIRTFKRESAEVPHREVAFSLSDSDTAWPDESEMAQSASCAEANVDELVDRAKAGDCAALDTLLVTVRPRALAAALKILHNRDDAEDAVQDAFMKAWRCLSTFEGRSSFATWIHRIVSNASLDLLRRGASRPETVERTDVRDLAVAELEPSHEQTPEAKLGDIELQLLVRAAVAALPSAHRQAVELREFEDRSYQEMAEIIDCPVGTVMSRLHHARNKLASELRTPLGESFEMYAA